MSMKEGTITKGQIASVMNALTEIVDSWNDAAQDDDRGRSNDLLILTVADDGSGHLGKRHPTYKGPYGSDVIDVEDWHAFKDYEDLFGVFTAEGITVEDDAEQLDEAECTLGDEEAAHQDTLRLWNEEKRRRVYYQDIVYAVCNELDRAFAKRVTRGEGTVCGTVDSPTTQVQDLLRELVDRDHARMRRIQELAPDPPQTATPKSEDR
jgi:hypothetical protein